ncbi:MAG: hypothetical protein ACOYPR_05560 [Saprospiraceae bacterium]|jgi:hypothetical protein
MNVLQIELIDPRARKLLVDMAEMNLIKIQDLGDVKQKFAVLLEQLRSKEETLTPEDILKEVEIVRTKRIAANESSH